MTGTTVTESAGTTVRDMYRPALTGPTWLHYPDPVLRTQHEPRRSR
jgi:hypothetical protein